MAAVWRDEYYQQGDKAKLLVSLAIADSANSEGFAFPSIDFLAHKARTRPRGVQEICRSLEQDGKLEIQIGKGRNGTNLYRLLGVRLSHPSDEADRVKQGAVSAGCGDRRVRSDGEKSGGNSAGKSAARTHPIHKEPSGTVKKSSGTVKAPTLSMDEFVAELKANPGYKGIDIDRELSRMDAWFQTPRGRGRKKTHGFILNWLNKAEPELLQRSNGGLREEALHQKIKTKIITIGTHQS